MPKETQPVTLKPEQAAALIRVALLEAVFCVLPATYFFLCSVETEGALFGAVPFLIQGEMPNILAGIGMMALGSVFLVRQVLELQSDAQKNKSRQSQ